MGRFKLVLTVLLSSVVIGIVFHSIIAPRELVVHSDIVSFLTGARMVKDGVNNELYDLNTQQAFQNKVTNPFKKEILPFKNFSVFTLPFIPLTHFPLRISYILFALFNLGLLGIIIYLSYYLFPKIKKINFWYLTPFIFLPNIIATILGQLSIILTFIFLLIYKFLKDKKDLLAGVFNALLLIKPQYIISFPFFLFLSRDRKKFLTGFLVTSLVILSISILLTGKSSLMDYPNFLLATENDSFGLRDQRMFTIASSIFYNSIIDISYDLALYLNAGIYVVFYFMFVKRAGKISLDLSLMVAIFLTLLFAVHVLEHDLAILTLPLLLLLNLASGSKKAKRMYLLLAILVFLIPAVVLLINPVLAGLITLILGFGLLYVERSTNFLWERKSL